MTQEDFLKLLKETPKNAYEVMTQDAKGLDLNEFMQQALLDKLSQDCQITKKYFEIIDSNQLNNYSVEELFKIWDQIQNLAVTIRNCVQLKLYESIRNENFESAIEHYTKDSGKLQLIIDQNLWWRKNGNKDVYEVYQIKDNKMIYECKLISIRKILIEEVGLNDQHPHFEVYLTHLLTEDFRENLVTHYVFKRLLETLNI